MDDLYREYVLEHYSNPLRSGLLDAPHRQYEDSNPLCGDYIHITLRLADDDTVEDIGWEGEGCAISQATASMLYDSVVGKPIEEVQQLDTDYVLELLNVPLSAVRRKCALLSLKVLKASAFGMEQE